MQLKLSHLGRLFMLSLAATTILFLSGLSMCEDFKQKVMAAVKAGDHASTMQMLYERQRAGGKPDVFFWQATAAAMAIIGNAEGATACIIKSIELGE